MKTSTIVQLFIALAVVGAAYWYGTYEAPPAPAAPVASVVYVCAEGQTIGAAYFEGEEVEVEPGEMPVPTGSVELMLSDGRDITLPQTLSASGTRYANSDESIIFWSKGSTAFIEENGEQTYAECAESQ